MTVTAARLAYRPDLCRDPRAWIRRPLNEAMQCT
jgi:hypothetical protein